MMFDEQGTLQFYGSGPVIWRAPYFGFGSWGTYTSVGIRGGDPSAIARKNSGKGRWIVLVGPRYTTDVENDMSGSLIGKAILYPNPVTEKLECIGVERSVSNVVCMDVSGRSYMLPISGTTVDVQELTDGVYSLRTQSGKLVGCVIKSR